MRRDLLRWTCLVAAAWAGLGPAGCVPYYHDPVGCGRSAPSLQPSDLQAVSTLGPARWLPARAYEPAAEEKEDTGRPGKGKDWLRIPPELPGAEAEPLKKLPKGDEERAQAIKKLYPPLPPLGPELKPAPGPDGRPLTLADLQRLATANSPALRRATADVAAARGAALQAGLHPNPIFGYAADQVQPGTKPNNNSGQQGVYINQLIKTGKKLELAQAAAGIDMLNAQVALRQAQANVAYLVRSNYFAVLVAQEGLLVSRALAELTDQTFRIQVQQVRGGQAAPYEPLQLYVFAITARTNLTQARNRYISAWKQLAAALGLPDMPYTEVAGRAAAPVPLFRYDLLREHVLANHTNVLTAENTILKARYNLRLAEVTRIPDLHTNTAFQHDNAAGNFQFNLQMGIDLPLWNRNQGNIQQARAQLARAQQDLPATRNDLVRALTEAFERYENTRALVAEYRDKILPNQVRVYRGIRSRYEQEVGAVGFIDIVNAQQNVAAALGTYLALLAGQWTAVADVANLLQTEDLYAPDAEGCGAQEELLPQCLLGGPLESPPSAVVAPVEEAPPPRPEGEGAP
jgi:cobalt-zinc-cadmium efflux system outer membrane protein